jgi:hypothetical protein
MELIFPFKNLTINTFIEFLSKRKLVDYIEYNDEKPKSGLLFPEHAFKWNITNFSNLLPDFENEIIQIINTTDQKTIDAYFDELQGNINHLKEIFTKDNIKNKIIEWNQEEEKNAKKQNLQPEIIDLSIIDEFHLFISTAQNDFLDIANKYLELYIKGEIKSKSEKLVFNKPAVFVEGEHDIAYINKAAELLGMQDLLTKIELRQRGGFRNLDKLWELYKDNNWETLPQRKLLLYDCDTKKVDEDLGFIYKRIIPSLEDGYITKGVENLFPKEIVVKAISVKKAFIDLKNTTGIERGVDYSESVVEVNKYEKKNFCIWICENGSKNDFKNFDRIFNIILDLL